MRIGILTQWFEPEPGPAALPGVLARGLVERGHSVQVLTGFPNYPSGVVAAGYRIRRRLDEDLEGLSVRRVALYPNHGTSAIGRVANYASFGASALVSGVSALAEVDALWVYNSPITVAWPMWAAKIRKKIPSVVHVMDLWPDSILLSGFVRRGLAFSAAEKLLNAWCNAMYRSASSVAYIAPSMGETLRRRGVAPEKLAFVPLWADEKVFRPTSQDLRGKLGISPDAIVLLYAGALGEAQGLATLIDACAEIRDPRFVCLIAGSGIAEDHVRDRAWKVGAQAVRFLGRLPQSEMTTLMATGDVNYIGLRRHALSEVTMPSKTQAILASGRALIVAATGDVAKVARECGGGWAVDPGDASAIASAIRAACELGRDGLHDMGVKARQYYERTFSTDRGVQRIESLLQHAADLGPPGRVRGLR